MLFGGCSGRCSEVYSGGGPGGLRDNEYIIYKQITMASGVFCNCVLRAA